MNNKTVIGVKIVLCLIILLAALNLIWKFSMGVPFIEMNSGRQMNVIASILVIVVSVPSLAALFVKTGKLLKNSDK